jgi:signal transduction histidine kinase
LNPSEPTDFLPSGRAPVDDLRRDCEFVESSNGFLEMLRRTPCMVMLLNEQRQLVWANDATLEAASGSPVSVTGAGSLPGIEGGKRAAVLEAVLGKRPGELLDCIHAAETAGGCGTTRFCRNCGAARALLASSRNESVVEECRLLVDRDGIVEAMDFRIWSSPLRLGDRDFLYFAALRIDDEKRRDFLERIFLHDILNSAGALRSVAGLLDDPNMDAGLRARFLRDVESLADQVVRELQSHRLLLDAENGELEVRPETLHAVNLLMLRVAAVEADETFAGRGIRIHQDSVDSELHVDPVLVSRVLGNMVKNALEASHRGDMVTLRTRPDGEDVIFEVHNPGAMTDEVRDQMFKRSFSTKGKGRGLGTWSMKMLAERYLRGSITFRTERGHGTTFTLRLPKRVLGEAIEV